MIWKKQPVGSKLEALNSKYGTFGSTSDPISSLADLPNYGCGFVVLSASLSPTGDIASFSFIKQGTKTRYTVTITQIQSNRTGFTYIGKIYDGTFSGWKKVIQDTSRVAIDRNEDSSLTDCDAVTEVGLYRIISTTQNAPTNYGVLFHMLSNNYKRQIAIGDNKEYYVRTTKSDAWDNWTRLLTADEFVNLNKIESTPVIDFDTETRFFVYFNYAYSTGTKPTATGGNNGYLVTFIRDPDNTKLQFCKYSNSSNFVVYMRMKVSGTWTAWKSITFT